MSEPRPLSTLPPTGDAVFAGASFRAGVLHVRLDHYDLGQIVVAVPTPAVWLSDSRPAPEHPVRHGVRLDLLRAEDRLGTERGFFMPGASFERRMQEVRLGLHLCYGLRASPALHVVRFVGYEPWAVCLCHDLSAVTWEPSRP